MNYSKDNSAKRSGHRAILFVIVTGMLFLAGCSTTPSKDSSVAAHTPAVPAQLTSKYKAAIHYMQTDNIEQAYQGFSELTVEYPGYSGPYINLGLIHLQRQQLDDAEAFFKKAISVNSSSFEGHNQLAIVYRKQGNFSAAETHYLKAKSIDNNSADLHKNIAILYDLYMGKLPQALAHYQQYKQLLQEPDPALRGWIIDIENRIRAQNRQASNHAG